MSDPKPKSFYLFDWDDNIAFMSTTILVLNTVTKETKEVSTGDFATVHPQLGNPGPWEDYTIFDGSYRNFRDLPADELEPGRRQRFVEDVEEAVESGDDWQAPAWPFFVYACEKQRPVSIVTARGHHPETLQEGVRVLVDKGLLPQEPRYHTVFPVGNDELRRTQLDDADLVATTPVLKKRAIIKTVDKAIEELGREAELSFGMSDDDPSNVSLIIRAMAECKQRYRDKRFFVINTHMGQQVKLEVFPIDMAVTGRPERVLGADD